MVLRRKIVSPAVRQTKWQSVGLRQTIDPVWIPKTEIQDPMALFCKGTNILVDPDGSCRRVEDLNVGDKIFDPLAQTLNPVTNIVPWVSGTDASTAPVIISKHALNASQPSEDFIAPQTLEVFVARIPKGQKVPVAQRILARDLVDEGLASIAEQLNGLQCYLVLTERAGLIMTNGVLSVGKSAPQQKRAQAT